MYRVTHSSLGSGVGLIYVSIDVCFILSNDFAFLTMQTTATLNVTPQENAFASLSARRKELALHLDEKGLLERVSGRPEVAMRWTTSDEPDVIDWLCQRPCFGNADWDDIVSVARHLSLRTSPRRHFVFTSA
jgi:hypothetical protein